jgi:lipopolysaccharide/colanic/teichoic acid biosynthesis glycosyltransferase
MTPLLKRFFDLIAAFFLLLFFSLLLLSLAILIRLRLGSPLIFCQVRPGLNAKPFKIYKFRTMKESADKEGNLLPDAQRLTKFGRFLRSTSLDELPALWNVIKGEMSFVGPRPLLMEYLPLYNKKQSRRHDVKPGITGWAQVNGRNTISWQEKFDLDVWYVENQSFWLDLKILLMTVKKVIIRDGISGGGEVTMSKFTGNNK